MSTEHRIIPAVHRHALPRFEFVTLGDATAHVYEPSDVSCMVRVGAAPGPYEHYMLAQVLSGVGTLVSLSGGGGVTDHGALTGLSDDDHTQYLRTDGSRALTGDMSAGTNRITNLKAPTSANDAARLTDIPTAGSTPSALTIGGTGAGGSAPTYSKNDHTHTLAGFGATAGTICEGNDARLIPTTDYATYWEPNFPPASPHASDDECNGNSIAGGWSTWDPLSTYTFSAQPTVGAYSVTGTGVASPQWGGLYKAIPNSVFQMVARVSIWSTGTSTAQTFLGLFVADFTSNFTGARYSVGVSTTSIATGQHRNLAGPGVNNSVAFSSSATTDQRNYWIRLRVNGTAVAADVSQDGVSWALLNTATVGVTPVHCGIVFGINSVGLAATGWIHCVRFLSGAGSDNIAAFPGGRLVKVPHS